MSSLIFIMLLATVSCQTIVTPNQVMTGGKFSIICDASRVPTLPSDANNIIKLTVFRNTTTYSLIAYYTTLTSSLVPSNSTSFPPGRNWNFTVSGGNGGSNNRNTMRLQVDVNDAMCSDAGTYICVVKYYIPPRELEVNAVQNLTTVARVSNLVLAADPYHASDQAPNHSDYADTEATGVTITFTCRAEGPTNVSLQWHYSTYNSFGSYNTPQIYPYFNDISETAPEYIGDTGSCAHYHFKSQLQIVATTSDDKNMYVCVVLDSRGQELVRENFTIGVSTKLTDLDQKQLPVVSVDSILDGEGFTITCDANRVTFPDEDIYADSISELAIETKLGTNETYIKVAQYLSCGPPTSLEYKNPPQGRDWVFSFMGSGNGFRNKKNMKIEIQVRDARITDAGMFQCKVRYYAVQGGISELSQEQNVTAQWKLQPVVNVDWKSDQESFTVTCNARRVTFPPAEFSAVVWKLQIAVMLGSSQSYRKVAEYLVCGPSDKLQFQNPPEGRNWVINYSGSNNGLNNRSTMKIEMQVQNATCSDAGRYRCIVTYYSSEYGMQDLQQEQNVTAQCS